MEVLEEEFGGSLVTLEQGDDLRLVPETHRHLITTAIQSWWADPFGALREIAQRAVSVSMRVWFLRMADRGDWCLELHKSSYGPTRAGYLLSCPGTRAAELGPPSTPSHVSEFPRDLADFYRLVSFVDWMGFLAAGGIVGPDEHMPLNSLGRDDIHGADIDIDASYVFGWSPCGDMLIYTTQGEGGWLCHDDGRIQLLGTVLDTVDWVFGELLADRCPEFPYGRS